MSGSVSAAVSVVSGLAASVRAANGLFAGPTGPVTIGGISLRDFEVPEQVSFGGQQQTTIHKFVGGARVVDVMGRDDKDYTWTAMMIGPDAVQRARALDLLRQNGAMVPLVFGDFAENVVIGSFEAEYKRANWIGQYSISLIIVSDAAPNSSGTSLLDAASGGLSAALAGIATGFATLSAVIAPVIAGPQTAIAAIGAVVLPTTGALGVAVPFLTQSQSSLAAAQGLVTALAGTSAGAAGLTVAQAATDGAAAGLIGAVAQTGAVLSGLPGLPDSLVADAPSLTVASAAAGEHAVMVQAAAQVSQTQTVLDAIRSDSARASAGFYLGGAS